MTCSTKPSSEQPKQPPAPQPHSYGDRIFYTVAVAIFSGLIYQGFPNKIRGVIAVPVLVGGVFCVWGGSYECIKETARRFFGGSGKREDSDRRNNIDDRRETPMPPPIPARKKKEKIETGSDMEYVTPHYEDYEGDDCGDSQLKDEIQHNDPFDETSHGTGGTFTERR